MRISSWMIAAAMLAGLTTALVGCQEHKPQPRQTPAQLQDRLANARGIGSNDVRDQALHDIAVDAAASRVGDVAVTATSSIGNAKMRDDTAEQAAKILDDHSDRASAERVVQLMSDSSRRDAMRSYLASRAPSAR
ncbi:MAG TPA: hypothetical protein VLI90_10975 [Tepidisphaeraceae bacterium]|nr:hypothetical protein [Tepidisphaeraceae bacterium]